MMKACYDPRNAVLFLDTNGKIIAVFEMCFECLGYSLSPKDFYIGDMRPCKNTALKKFFEEAGIHYGIDADEE